MISPRIPAALDGLDLVPVMWSSRSVVIVVDATGTIVDTNAAFARLAGAQGAGAPISGLAEGQEEAFDSWLTEIGPAWGRRAWGLFPGSDGVPRDFLVTACRTSDDMLVIVGEPLNTEDISAALLDVNETLVVEHRRLDRERSRLDRVAGLDALTGIPNRRAFDRRLAFEIERAAGGASFAVVMIDIDHFKAVNDRFGHPTGDAVLRWLGERLESAARRGDFVARYGGEEFVAIIPDASAVNARAWADRLRHTIRDGRVPGLDMVVTASFGVAAWSAGDTGQRVVDRADEALYAAKESGRDRVAVATERRGAG
jgi:diguanylate cyclase (GGDEF)-like protein